MRSLLLVFISLGLFANTALVCNKDLKYKEYLDYENLSEVQIEKKINCKAFNKANLLQQKYIATRYISKNTPICDKDVELATNKKVKFDFGNIEIEKEGEFIGETDKYVKIKNPDGTTVKIDKNGL
ncbi:MAG: hypothetical protein HY307_04400 [Arcobacter sp.]|nr:hypothetical protein [Arcobacter sp.]